MGNSTPEAGEEHEYELLAVQQPANALAIGLTLGEIADAVRLASARAKAAGAGLQGTDRLAGIANALKRQRKLLLGEFESRQIDLGRVHWVSAVYKAWEGKPEKITRFLQGLYAWAPHKLAVEPSLMQASPNWRVSAGSSCSAPVASTGTAASTSSRRRKGPTRSRSSCRC